MYLKTLKRLSSSYEEMEYLVPAVFVTGFLEWTTAETISTVVVVFVVESTAAVAISNGDDEEESKAVSHRKMDF